MYAACRVVNENGGTLADALAAVLPAAAPQVAGVVSMMLARDPTLTPGRVLSILQGTARDFPVGSVCRNGNVTVEPRDLKAGIEVRNDYGAIDFIWPSGEKARLEARSKGGSVSWGLPGKPDLDETNGASVVKAFSSDLTAPLVFLSTTYDTVRIQEGPRKF